MSRKSVTILGATGSIGSSTVSVIADNPDRFTVNALVANKNTEKLAAYAKQLGAGLAVVADETKYAELKELLAGTDIKAAAGQSGVFEAVDTDADIVVSAIVGASGLQPTVRAVKKGKRLALANKETIVCAGSLVMDMVKQYNAELVPVDSEHSAIFQSLNKAQRNKNQLAFILLTASGGPFRDKDLAFMEGVTPEMAVAHPNWSMGKKISVDSATMMNKGLEIIEAYHLFDVPLDKIQVVIHPQSILHSAVAYTDGAVMAEMGLPDMKTPIAYALGFPDRIPSGVKDLNLAEIGQLAFYPSDEVRFPALRLAKQALRQGGAACNVLNAANEAAVAAFLDRKIPFLSIAKVVEETLSSCTLFKADSMEDVLQTDVNARITASEIIKRYEKQK